MLNEHESPEPFCEMTGPMGTGLIGRLGSAIADASQAAMLDAERRGYLACEEKVYNTVADMVDSVPMTERQVGWNECLSELMRRMNQPAPETCCDCGRSRKLYSGRCRPCGLAAYADRPRDNR